MPYTNFILGSIIGVLCVCLYAIHKTRKQQEAHFKARDLLLKELEYLVTVQSTIIKDFVVEFLEWTTNGLPEDLMVVLRSKGFDSVVDSKEGQRFTESLIVAVQAELIEKLRGGIELFDKTTAATLKKRMEQDINVALYT